MIRGGGIVPDFAELLKTYREAAGFSQRSLARSASINPAIISRIESGDRGPSGSAQVVAIARALKLDQEKTDSLLARAGFWPEVYQAVGPQDPTLLTVARLLADRRLGKREHERFRRVVALLAEQWAAALARPEGTP